jgi:hypothetical protein
MPAPVRSAFVRALEDDDDEKEKEGREREGKKANARRGRK